MAKEADAYLETYAEYSKVLRTWFVAYGIGAPVVLFTHDALSETVKTSGNGRFIAGLFVLGVCFQVILAAVNKTSMWALYYGEIHGPFKGRLRYKIAYWFSEAFWIDLAIDLVTMVLFGLATWKVFGLLV